MDWFFAIGILGAITEASIALIFYTRFFQPRHLNWVAMISSVIIFTVIMALSYLLIQYDNLSFLLTILCYFLLTLLFSRQIKTNIFPAVLLIGFVMLSELISIFGLGWIIGRDATELISEDSLLFAATIISRFILLILVKGVCNFRKNNYVRISAPYWFLLIAIPTVSIIFIRHTLISSFANDIGATDSVLLYFFGLLFINILVFHLLEKMALKKRNQHLQDRIDLQMTQYRLYIDKQKEKERLFHDHGKQLDAIFHLAEESGASNIMAHISSLQDVREVSDAHIRTGNIAIDAIFNAKIQVAQSKGIKVDYEVVIPSGLQRDSVVFCIMFANIWDNAIEACTRIPEDQRFIRATLRYSDKWLRFKMVNATNGKLVRRGAYYKTSKTGGGMHGLGLENIDHSVKNCGGALAMEHDNKNRTFTLAFRIYASAPGKENSPSEDSHLMESA